MQMNHRLTTSVCTVLVVCLMISAMSFAVLAIAPPSLDEKGSITLQLRGGRVELYAVATIESLNGPLAYVYTPAFAGCGLDIGMLTSPDYASSLATWAYGRVSPMATKDSGLLGRVKFDNLVPGAYLLIQTHAAMGYTKALPFIVTIPMQNGTGGWNYEINANLKVGTDTTPIPPSPVTTPGPVVTTAPPVTTTAPDVTTTAPDVTTAPDETTRPPETTTAPPETTTVPPETTTVPPETTIAPPETTIAPPETTIAPPETTTVPPETTTAPPETTTVPPETTTAPPETTTVPVETTNPKEPDLPQTGQNDRPIMILAVVGMMLFAAGWLLRFGRRDEHAE